MRYESLGIYDFIALAYMFVLRILGVLPLAVVNVMVVYTLVFAGEQTGNLVFNAVKALQENHQMFLSDVQEIKADREEANVERKAVKSQYERARDGSLDKREFHARYSYALAKVFRTLYEEGKLTHQVSGKNLKILYRLDDSIGSQGTAMHIGGAMSIVEATRPFLENGTSLLFSLAQYRDKITDPVINSKLNGAYETARMLSGYLKDIDERGSNKYTSQQALKQRIGELIASLNALYLQSDIFMAMIQDKTTVLKILTELAASETAIHMLSDGKKIIGRLHANIMEPLMDIARKTDDDLATLTDGVLGDGQGRETHGISQSWTIADFQ